MKLISILVVCLAARLAPAQQHNCRQVNATEIQGKDLAAALPAFDGLPANLVLGNMPLPGSSRTFHAAELQSIAQRYSLQLHNPADICFEWPMEPLKRDRVEAAMRDSLPVDGAQLEIVETSIYPVPHGKIEFPWTGLTKPAASNVRSAILWRGDVIYGGGERYAIWARVRVTANCGRISAAENLKPGVPVTANQLRSQAAEGFPDPDRCPATPSRYVGMVAVHAVSAGEEIRPGMLQSAFDVTKGDDISVEVRSGMARLELTARAEMNGRSGDVITVRNPNSNKIFRARVSGKQRATVVAGSPGGF